MSDGGKKTEPKEGARVAPSSPPDKRKRPWRRTSMVDRLRGKGREER